MEAERTLLPIFLASEIFLFLYAAFGTGERIGTETKLFVWDGDTSSWLLPIPCPVHMSCHRSQFIHSLIEFSSFPTFVSIDIGNVTWANRPEVCLP